uniref:Stromal cell-derived factor 1 n=1 Tax=Capra hircus TaxID=9925 RepID=A0A8C2RXF9_CAPHI
MDAGTESTPLSDRLLGPLSTSGPSHVSTLGRSSLLRGWTPPRDDPIGIVSKPERTTPGAPSWMWGGEESSLIVSGAKPVSLSYRCPCRFFESHVAKANVKHLKILNTPNCALQIVARLKNNNRQVCIDPKLKWIQEYLDKALNKLSDRSRAP